MFPLLARFLLASQRIPWIVLALSIVLTLFSILPVSHLSWELAIADLLPSDLPARSTQEAVQKKFGGQGTLTIVVHSPDSLANHRFIQSLSDSLQGDSRINFTEYRTEANFYRRHKFLYIRLSDLELIHGRIKELVQNQKARYNPFLVQIIDETADSNAKPNLVLEDLEKKYLDNLQDYLGNETGTIRVLEIYPSHDVADLEAMRALYKRVRSVQNTIKGQEKLEIVYGGLVFDQVATSKTLLAEARKTAWISGGIVLLLLLLRFFRHPQAPLLATIPLAMVTLWSLAGAELLYGRINLFTLLLGLVIPGVGGGMCTHLLSRYSEERRKGLSPELALESTILGMGPPVTVSAFTSAAAFFCLSLLPLAGIQEFGIVGGIGILLNWIAVGTVLPALLLVLQRKHFFRVYGPSIIKRRDFWARPFRIWKRVIVPLVIFTLLAASQGVLPRFNYHFSDTEYQKPSLRAKQLLEKAGQPNALPAIIQLPDALTSELFLRTIQDRQEKDPSPTVDRVATFSSLLPRFQEEKLKILADIHAMLTPEVISTLRGVDSANVRKIMENWDTEPLTVEDLPFAYRRKFQGRDGSVGEFGFIFPSIDADDGLECRHFAEDVRDIPLPNGETYHTTGTPIIRAALLDLTLPELHISLWTGIAVIVFLVLLFQNRLYRTLLTLVSPAIGFLWLLSLMRLFHIDLNAYSALVFPLLIGMAVDGALHLWHRYQEESTGSLHYILRHTGVTVCFASATTLVAFSGLLFSSHPGLRSMGLVAVLGLACLLAAHLTIFPLVAGWLDMRRYRNRERMGKSFL
jgi:uncharacterized protein